MERTERKEISEAFDKYAKRAVKDGIPPERTEGIRFEDKEEVLDSVQKL